MCGEGDKVSRGESLISGRLWWTGIPSLNQLITVDLPTTGGARQEMSTTEQSGEQDSQDGRDDQVDQEDQECQGVRMISMVRMVRIVKRVRNSQDSQDGQNGQDS